MRYLLFFAACFCAFTAGGTEFAARRDVELALKKQQRLLLQPNYRVAADQAALGIRFGPDTLKTHALYLKQIKQKQFVYISPTGAISGVAAAAGRLQQAGELVFSRDNQVVLFIDDRPFQLPGEWQLYWAAAKAEHPRVRKISYPRRQLADSFMRTSLTADSDWKVVAGKWTMRQHGGGLAETEAEIENYSVQRAVNPFSVIGSQSGVLSLGNRPWFHAHVEARFYFGRPKTGNVVDWNSLPVGTDMMLAQGRLDGRHVAFGWSGSDKRFLLKQRSGNGKWETLWTAPGKRPPVTNWVRIGLSVAAGCRARAWLDGKCLADITLKHRIEGPLHVIAGPDEMEFDDVRAWTLPAPAGRGAALFVQSRQFAGKKRKGHADPKEYLAWTRSTDTFVQRTEAVDEHWRHAVILSQMPLMGDFDYESVPYHKDAGNLPTGIYQIRFLTKNPEDPFDLDRLQPAVTLEFLRDEHGWSCPELDGLDEENPAFTLRFRRRAADNNRIAVQVGNRYIPVSKPVDGPVHFAVARLLPAAARPRYPSPRHHMIYCPNLTNEFFEQAPTDWSWVEGAFRMDSRWACQDQWNFLACGSVGVPMMVSKRRYKGHQEHEYFMTIRPVYPWDAGDDTFEYDPRQDRGFKFFRKHNGWYNRHDLNFSFCMNGRDPLSGYSVVYAAADNRETWLMRRGRIVARTTEQLIPTARNHGVVHWRWWKFHVRKYGRRIRVQLNDQLLFDYTDDDPLDGGHVAYWSVRNGFIVSRAISMAAGFTTRPHVLYVDNDIPSGWQPLWRDTVTLSRGKAPLDTVVTSNAGAGFHAVRWHFDNPVDLQRTPILALPLQLPPEARRNLHLQIGDTSYLIRLNAPTTAMKSLLTREFETGEQFQRQPWPDEQVRHFLLGSAAVKDRLRFDVLAALKRLDAVPDGPQTVTVTLGNTSNADYLLAGNGGNTAGTTVRLGRPAFLPAE